MFYEKGLRFNPSSLILIYNLARNYMILCKFKLSIVWFELGLKLKPRWVNGLVGLALTYFEMGYNSRAVNCIKAAHNNINLVKFDKVIDHGLRSKTPSTVKSDLDTTNLTDASQQRCHFLAEDIKLLEATMNRAHSDFKSAAIQYKHLMPQLLKN